MSATPIAEARDLFEKIESALRENYDYSEDSQQVIESPYAGAGDDIDSIVHILPRLVDYQSTYDAMKEALEGMLEWARRVKHPNPGTEIANAIKALALAEGKEQMP